MGKNNRRKTDRSTVDVSRRDFLLTTGAALAIPPFVRGRAAKVWTLPERRGFKTIDTLWVPMKDGTRIAVRLWIPDGAEQKPVPVVMEYIPYGRMFVNAGADILAPHGIAYARPDIRGSGDSEGVLSGEYLQQEQDDGVEIIAWLASQPWCNGSVGMRGLSWGGFAALQIAAMAPPALKAIMAHCATDNRYTDDVHYIGGLLSRANYNWGTNFRNLMASPPDPAFVGEDRWRGMWMERLKTAAPILAEWTEHQRYDGFWQHGSVQVDYSHIQCPVYAVGGQVDAYRDFIPRLLSHLEVPRKGLMGPWGHTYPNAANPGPGLEWAVEEVRWWTHWLQGEDTGIMDEPMLRVYMESRTASEVWPEDVPGRWVAEQRWPAPGIDTKTLFLNADGLGPAKGRESVRPVKSQETVGLTKPAWLAMDMKQQLPRDQTPDDKRSVVFDSDPLETDMELLGNPRARVRLSSDQPVASLAVRLNEVTAEGKSWSVTYGLLNLTHRASHEQPSPLEPGRIYDMDVSCYFTAHRFKKGNRIRVAITESLWPMVWPSPRPVELSIVTGASMLTLPVRPPEAVDQTPPIPLMRGRTEQQAETQRSPTVQTKTDADGRVTIGATGVNGTGWSASIQEGDPNSCVWKRRNRSVLNRGEVDVTLYISFELTSTPDEFRLKESLHAMDGDTEVFAREWDRIIERDLI